MATMPTGRSDGIFNVSGLTGSKWNSGRGWQLLSLDPAELRLHLLQRLGRVYVTGNDEDGVVGRIPGVVELAQSRQK